MKPDDAASAQDDLELRRAYESAKLLLEHPDSLPQALRASCVALLEALAAQGITSGRTYEQWLHKRDYFDNPQYRHPVTGAPLDEPYKPSPPGGKAYQLPKVEAGQPVARPKPEMSTYQETPERMSSELAQNPPH